MKHPTIAFFALLTAIVADGAVVLDIPKPDVAPTAVWSEPPEVGTVARCDSGESWREEFQDAQTDCPAISCATGSSRSADFAASPLPFAADTENNGSMTDPITGAESTSAAVARKPATPTNDLVLIGGYGDLRQSKKAPTGAVDVRFAKDYFGLHPYINLAWGNCGSRYAGAGLLYVFEMPRRWRLTVGTGPGGYRHKRGTTDLGYGVEFHSWLEVSRVVFGRRIGLSYGHVSNAHLGARNPGSENVSLSVIVHSW